MLAAIAAANLDLSHPNPYSPLAELNVAQRTLLRTLLHLVKRLRHSPQRLLALYPRVASLFPKDLREELEGSLPKHRELIARILAQTTLLEYSWLLRELLFPAPFPQVDPIPPQPTARADLQMLTVHHMAKHLCRQAAIGNPLTLQVRVTCDDEGEAAATADLIGDFFFHRQRRSAFYCSEGVQIGAAVYTHRRTAVFELHKGQKRRVSCEIAGTSGLISTAYAEPFDSHFPPMVVYHRDVRVVFDHLVGPHSLYLPRP